jgi:4-hydroxy-2-oxoheptanedioate aldolase
MIPMPSNRFKQALSSGQPQIGLWCALANAYAIEVSAGAGFDWLLLDGEHAPNDLQSMLAQLQAVAAYPETHAVVRPVSADPNLIKQLLDIGAQSLLVPMIETAEQAAAVVAATQYPPAGIRGVGSALGRASRWNRVPRYLQTAADELCVMVQVESRRGVDNLEAIAATEGIDGVFIGPSDLAAAYGHLGNPGHPEMQALIEGAIVTIRKAGKACGILAFDEALARRYMELGCNFAAVGADIVTLARETQLLAEKYKAR